LSFPDNPPEVENFPKVIAMFVDRVEIELRAGRGGDGCMSFRREKFVSKGGPDGGDGGDGASIILEARDGVNSLSQFANRKFWRANSGGPGTGKGCHGRAARDLTLYVPPGTALIDAQHHFVIKDLIHTGDKVIVCRGGKKGRGNIFFKSAQNQAPRERTPGEDGEVRAVILELKSIADVGLIGMPNAGKSTMLSRMSAARPEIADYPFTTKFPNLGIVRPTLDTSFALADIPGLIEGASEGIGLGHEFLRHVERAGLLVHLVETAPTDGSDPVQNYLTIRSELESYSPDLATRDEIVLVSKSELPGSETTRDLLAEAIGKEVRLVSAVTGDGLQSLTYEIMSRLVQWRKQQDDLPVARPWENPDTVQVEPVVEPLSDAEKAFKKRRIPPHLAGLTATLSDDNQPRNFVEEEKP